MIKNTQGLPPASPTAPFNSNTNSQSSRPTNKNEATGGLLSSAEPSLPPWPSLASPTVTTSLATEETPIDHPPPPTPTFVEQVCLLLIMFYPENLYNLLLSTDIY